MTPTLLLPRDPSPETIALRTAALEQGWEVVRSGWRLPDNLPKNLVVYGGDLFCSFVVQELDLTVPGVPVKWLPDLPEDLLRRKVQLMTREEAGKHEGRVFFKPADDKWFPNGIHNSGTGLPGYEPSQAGRPVYVAEEVRFLSEYRVFLRDGVALTGSRYAQYGLPTEPEPAPADALRTAEKAAPGLPAGAVVDVGVIPGRGWAVVEANPAHESALYGCDPAKVLLCLAALFEVA